MSESQFSMWPELSKILRARYKLDEAYEVTEVGLSVDCFDDTAAATDEPDEDDPVPYGREEAMEYARTFVAERHAPAGFAIATLTAVGRPTLLAVVPGEETRG